MPVGLPGRSRPHPARRRARPLLGVRWRDPDRDRQRQRFVGAQRGATSHACRGQCRGPGGCQPRRILVRRRHGDRHGTGAEVRFGVRTTRDAGRSATPSDAAPSGPANASRGPTGTAARIRTRWRHAAPGRRRTRGARRAQHGQRGAPGRHAAPRRGTGAATSAAAHARRVRPGPAGRGPAGIRALGTTSGVRAGIRPPNFASNRPAAPAAASGARDRTRWPATPGAVHGSRDPVDGACRHPETRPARGGPWWGGPRRRPVVTWAPWHPRGFRAPPRQHPVPLPGAAPSTRPPMPPMRPLAPPPVRPRVRLPWARALERLRRPSCRRDCVRR